MMELWDLYSRERVPLGRAHVRGEALPENCFHLVVHVWLQNAQGKYLISQREESRPTFPLMWETTGGSVVAGEDSLTGALREAREELGVVLSPKAGRLVFSQVRDWVDGQRFGDILDVWCFNFEGQPQLAQADGEVREARWMDRQEIEALYDKGKLIKTLNYFFTEPYFINGTEVIQ